MKDRSYRHLDFQQLEERLNAAEDVCALYGWGPVKERTSDREKALHVLWRRWLELVTTEPSIRSLDPSTLYGSPHLNDEAIADLASQDYRT